MKTLAQSVIKTLAGRAGITIDGSNPWDIQVLDKRFYKKLLHGGSLAFGEMYIDQWWTVDQLDLMFERLFENNIESKFKSSWPVKRLQLKSKMFNRQSFRRAFKVGQKHYDIDNSLYALMLDSNMVYSCGYWHNANDLEQAQLNKLDLICRKLELKPGMKLLDIGCGWGSLVKYASEHYGVSAKGITVSRQQAEFAREMCAGLPIEIGVMDYRKLGTETFNVIACVGMIEHVGYKNYRHLMQKVSQHLKPEGLFLLHTIGNNESEAHTDPWIEKYIFPNSMIPSLQQLTQSCEQILSIEDLHSFGRDYDKTLLAWYANFTQGWGTVKDKYGDRFFRMWEYYLLMSAAGFRTQHLKVWQFVMTHLEHRFVVNTVR